MSKLDRPFHTAFTDLAATAIGRLAQERHCGESQTLVARGVPPAEVIAAVAEEIGRVLDIEVPLSAGTPAIKATASAIDAVPLGASRHLGSAADGKPSWRLASTTKPALMGQSRGMYLSECGRRGRC
jgi:hypothetical protein